jgi:hypothetical protein
MELAITRTAGSAGIPIWQGTGKDIQLAQGGFLLSVTGYLPYSTISAGTPVVFDEAARTATITGSGTLQAAATGTPTQYRLNKGHGFKVGDYMAAAGTGGAAYAITAIDQTNTSYDLVTLGTTIGNLAVGAGVYASTATGASASAYPTGVNGLLYADCKAVAGESCSVVIRGTIYARRMASYSAALAALTGLKNIIFSQSK